MATPGTRWQRGRQVVFGPLQVHSRMFELGMIVFCILCIVLAVVIAKGTDWGVTTRP
jgi:flagellar biosynthesis component FlhA